MSEGSVELLKILSDNFSEILTVVGSLGSAIVGGIIGAQTSRNNETRKIIRERRMELYFEFYSEIEVLINDRQTIFSTAYFNMLVKYKPKMKLLSSPETYNALERFYNYVRDVYYDYQHFLWKTDPANDPAFTVTVYDEDGQPLEETFPPEEELEIFEAKIEKYKKEHVPTLKKINETFLPLYNSMRKDIGTDRIER